MSIRIVVGGPPHSGKSTLVVRLYKTLLEKLGVDVNYQNLDPWDRSSEVMLGIISEEERKQKNEGITKKDLRKLATNFRKLSKKHKVVLGDLPGHPTDLAKIVASAGKYGIIVCRDDELDKITEWQKFFSDNNVELIGIIHTSMEGSEEVELDGELIKSRLVKLDKSIIITPGMRSLASLLKSKLGF